MGMENISIIKEDSKKIMIFSKFFRYEGQWFENMIDGYGIMFFDNGEIAY